MLLPLKDDIPTSSFPFVTIGIIVSNLLVFYHQTAMGFDEAQQFIVRWGAIPHHIVNGEWIHAAPGLPWPFTVFSSMFLHGGFLHLFGNMLYLWIFGNNIEDTLGHLRFFVFYVLCGLFAAGAQIYSNPNSVVPMIGASGAIAGVLGAYLLLFPGGRVLTLVFIVFFIRLIRIPALIVLGFWFLIQVLGVVGGTEENVALFAHIGGFIAGLILVKFFQPARVRSRARWS